jgi:hypothetical protein
MKVIKIQPMLDSFSKSFQQYLPLIFWAFTEFNEKLKYFTKVMKVYKSLQYSTKLMKFFGIIIHFHSFAIYFVEFRFRYK